jgi:hypothetical protein
LPGKTINIRIVHEDGSKDLILANHTYNEGQIGWFVAGSALNLIAAESITLILELYKTLCETELFLFQGMLNNYNELLKLFKTQIIRLNLQLCNTFNASLVVIS